MGEAWVHESCWAGLQVPWVGLGPAASPSQDAAGLSVVQGWEVQQGSCFQGSSWDFLIPKIQL